jgi:hypothetical protein
MNTKKFSFIFIHLTQAVCFRWVNTYLQKELSFFILKNLPVKINLPIYSVLQSLFKDA